MKKKLLFIGVVTILLIIGGLLVLDGLTGFTYNGDIFSILKDIICG